MFALSSQRKLEELFSASLELRSEEGWDQPSSWDSTVLATVIILTMKTRPISAKCIYGIDLYTVRRYSTAPEHSWIHVCESWHFLEYAVDVTAFLFTAVCLPVLSYCLQSLTAIRQKKQSDIARSKKVRWAVQKQFRNKLQSGKSAKSERLCKYLANTKSILSLQ